VPVFLENLLYQIPSITQRRQFAYPAAADSPFSYLTCGDLGEVFAQILMDPPVNRLGDTPWTGSDQLTCRQLAALLTESLGTEISFRRQPGGEFVNGLVDKGMSEHASQAVLGLWQEIERFGDITPNDTFAGILGRQPTSAAEWTKEHACCFGSAEAGPCWHPKPPKDHMF
jgi:uncharacterized protein YbjT (DUF2867 family)